MGKARNLSKLSSVLTTDGSVPAAKGGTGTTTGASGGSSGPKITAITVTDSSYTNLDDLAVDVLGGYIKITGTGFATGCQVLVNTVTATSVTFISETEVRAQVPATAAGTYVVYLVNSDGGVAIRVNGISFSALPTWTSGSGLAGAVNAAISIQLTATGAATFTLASGSSLPSGVSLSLSGLISGTVTGISSETTYNFTVVATDSELQDSPRAFALTVTVGDPYFKYNSLLLSANGTNNAQNNAFVDSSTNNFAITRSGNTTQGTFSPYGANWSNYFDGTGDNLSLATATALGTGNTTVEFWFYTTDSSATYRTIYDSRSTTSTDTGYAIFQYGLTIEVYGNGLKVATSASAFTVNNWVYVALVRTSGTCQLYINGVASGSSGTYSANLTSTVRKIGDSVNTLYPFVGYISNLREVTSALYSGTFTPSTTPLTAITNTSLLTCQSNRFIDNSINAFTVTKNGDVSVQRFSPFSPTTAYSTSTIGGSAYFDGTGDYLNVATSTAFGYGTGDFTIELWTLWGGTLNSGNGGTLVEHRSAVLAEATVLYLSTAGVFQFYDGPAGVEVSSGVNISRQWTHVALTRASGVWRLFVNGTLVASRTSSSDLGSTKPCLIGQGQNGSSTSYNGYISNVRIVKGSAVYTSAFTPPTAPLTAITNTSLLLNYTNAGIVDGTMQNVLETVGDAKISTAQSKFGGSSLFFDGTGDYLKSVSIPSTNLSTGDFTIEFWVYPQGSGYFPCMVWWGNSSNNISAQVYCSYDTGTNALYLLCGDNTGTWLVNTTGGAITPNAWQHIAIVRYGSAFTLYKNGVSTLTGTSSGALVAAPITNYVGARVSDVQYFNGYIDDLRVTRGVARYTANFTPPASAAQTQ